MRRVLCAMLAMWLCSAQIAVAAHTCVQTTAAPMQHPCAEDSFNSATDSANLCAEHCKYGNQGDQLRLPATAPAVWQALYPAAVESTHGARPLPMRPPDARVPIGPPHAIVHCVLRT